MVVNMLIEDHRFDNKVYTKQLMITIDIMIYGPLAILFAGDLFLLSVCIVSFIFSKGSSK